MQRPRN